MKNAKQKIGKLTTLILSLFLIIASCNKDDTPEDNNPDPNPDNPDGIVEDPVPEEDNTTSLDPNLVTQSLILDNMQIIEGELPGNETSKSMLVDLKIDNDTIFWTPGIIKRLAVKKPIGTSIQGAWVQVTGAETYLETNFREDENSEEVSILYFGFDATTWELPINFSLKIVSLDDTGTPLDEFELPVVIEEPFVEGDLTAKNFSVNDCNWLVDYYPNWRFEYMVDKNLGLLNAHYYPRKTSGSTPGCCIGGQSEPNGFCEPKNKKQLDYENLALTQSMFFSLFPSGEVFGREKSFYQNVSIFDSDFCSNIAEYTTTYGEGLTHTLPLELEGKHNIDGCIMTITDVSLNETGIGAGNAIEFIMVSNHYLVERFKPSSDLPDGLGSAIKVYQLSIGLIDFDIEEWYD
ncbi:hypothetical protein N9954_01925 [Maribacter sp.]|nr:hypothetical protein [Maribacter sp.]